MRAQEIQQQPKAGRTNSLARRPTSSCSPHPPNARHKRNFEGRCNARSSIVRCRQANFAPAESFGEYVGRALTRHPGIADTWIWSMLVFTVVTLGAGPKDGRGMRFGRALPDYALIHYVKTLEYYGGGRLMIIYR
jgi:hypothetical protein